MPRTASDPDYADDRIRSFLRRVKGWGDATKDLARWQLNTFAAWCASEGVDLGQVTEAHLDEYIGHQEQRVAPTTVQGHIQSLRKFYGWLHAEGDIDHNPARRLTTREVAETPQHDVTELEHRRMVKTCDRRTVIGRRNEAILEVLWSTGIRRGELQLLDRVSFNPQSGVLVVAAPKTGEMRQGLLSGEALDALDRYLRRRRDACPALFATTTGNRLSLETISGIVVEAGAAAKIGRRVGVHEYRRAFTIWFLGQGGSQAGIEALNGWRPGSRMVGRYSRRASQDLALAETARLRAQAAGRSRKRRA